MITLLLIAALGITVIILAIALSIALQDDEFGDVIRESNKRKRA